MSIQIDPREVLEHLQYLGYRSITKEQLKEFVRDLKRLIKYEESKGEKGYRENGSSGKVSVACETSFPFAPFSEGSRDVNIPEHDHPCCSGASSSQTLQDKSSSIRSYHPDDYIEEETRYRECDDCPCDREHQKKDSEELAARISSKSEKPPQPIPSWDRYRASSFSQNPRRKIRSTEIIRSAKARSRAGRCDPVALYHYYQNQWSKRPLPGEDPRADLRWAVRTRLAQQQTSLSKGLPVEGARRKFQL